MTTNQLAGSPRRLIARRLRAIENCLKSVLGKPESDGKSTCGMSAKADCKAVEGNLKVLEKR